MKSYYLTGSICTIVSCFSCSGFMPSISSANLGSDFMKCGSETAIGMAGMRNECDQLSWFCAKCDINLSASSAHSHSYWNNRIRRSRDLFSYNFHDSRRNKTIPYHSLSHRRHRLRAQTVSYRRHTSLHVSSLLCWVCGKMPFGKAWIPRQSWCSWETSYHRMRLVSYCMRCYCCLRSAREMIWF